MRKRILWTVFMVFACHCVIAQATQFQATSDSKQVVVNGVFKVYYSLNNANGRDFQAPQFDGFDVISGPSLSMSTTISNGRRSESRSYTYTLLATEEGTFTIPAARIRAGNTLMESNKLTIQVVKGKPGTLADGNTMPTDEQVFVRTEIDSTLIYPGQQVHLEYKLYTTVNIRNYNTIKEDQYDDFYFRYVKNFNERAYLEVIDGVQYRVLTLKSLVLFPQKTGVYNIDPLIVNVGISIRDERRSFFFNTRTIPKTLTSNGLTINVVSLPEPQPESFTGAIGTYEMAVQVNRRELTTDDALLLTVHIVGDGDAKRWTPPTLSTLVDRFEMYDPKIIQDKSVDAGGYLQNSKIVEYLLIPYETGQQHFNIDFTYFDVDSNAYQTLRSKTISINVTQGTGQDNGKIMIADKMQKSDIYGLQSATRFSKAPPVFLFSPLYGALATLPLLALAGAFFIQRRRSVFAGMDPTEQKKLRALRTALKHLEHAKMLIDGDSREFHEGISLALFGYVSSKLKIRVSELSKDNIERSMESAGITESHRNAVLQIIRRSEMVLYAAGTAGSGHQSTYHETLELITGIERVLS